MNITEYELTAPVKQGGVRWMKRDRKRLGIGTRVVFLHEGWVRRSTEDRKVSRGECFTVEGVYNNWVLLAGGWVMDRADFLARARPWEWVRHPYRRGYEKVGIFPWSL